MSHGHSPAIPARSLTGMFLVWLAVIIALKWPSLAEPPVWDAVFGLFPAAGDLADNGFNLSSLLQKPSCRVGGPNTHSESLVTWISAGVLWLLGKGPRAFAALHVLHFSAAAWALSVLHRFLVPLWGRAMAWLFCGTLLLCPLFRVQVGALYFEIPLTACTVAAVVSFSDGKLGRAVVWSTLGVLVKQAGLVTAGALTVAAFCQPGSLTSRLRRSGSFAACGLAAAFWPLMSTSILSGVADKSPRGSWWQYFSTMHVGYLMAIPDIAIAFGLVALIGLLRWREIWNALTKTTAANPVSDSKSLSVGSVNPEFRDTTVASKNPPERMPPHALGVSFLLVVMFALFFFVTPYIARLFVLGLPRYLVFILPFIFFALTHWLVLWSSLRIARMAMVCVAMLFFGNREGLWYPKDGRDEISVLERGENYRLMVEVQREAAHTAANLPDDVVLYYGFEDHFFQKYPWLGYADRTHPGGHSLGLASERPKSSQMQDLPERFFVIYSNPYLFGREANTILRNASKDPTRQVRLYRRCKRGPYKVDILEVTTVAQAPAVTSVEPTNQK